MAQLHDNYMFSCLTLITINLTINFSLIISVYLQFMFNYINVQLYGPIT